MITWTKLKDGSWGLRGPKSILVANATVQVSKKDGTTSQVQVGKVLWTDGTIALATVVEQTKSVGVRTFSGKTVGARKTCWECGCSFTFQDARRNGGDWSDGYCGC